MAYAYRLDDSPTAFIRLTRSDLAPGLLRVYLVLDNVARPVSRARLEADTLTLADEVCEMERIIQRRLDRQVSVLLRDETGAMPDYQELVLFHHSFFAPFFDYARCAPDTRAYPRPELLACFTHAYDDGDMLRFWEAHHARFVPHRHLYVIDHGSPVSPRAVLHPETNVLSIPRGPVDHANIARFCGAFQRFLLSQYRFVLHTDADELVVHEGGPQALLAGLEGGALAGILIPAQAWDVLHDPATEGPLKPGEDVSAQRGSLLPAGGMYRKPVLADRPVSWLQGFHLAYEEHEVREVAELWLLHLQAADFGLLQEKNRRWNAQALTEEDRRICPQNRPVEDAELRAWFAERLRKEGRTGVPERLRGLF